MTDAATAGSSTLELPANEADALSDVEIVIEGEAVVVGAPEKKVETEPESGIAELKKQLADYNARALAAERERDAANAQVAQVSRHAVDANLGMVTSSIEAATSASKTAKADYQKAMEAGDYVKAADAQEAMADARANLLRLQERKADIESGRAQPQQQQRQQPVVSKIEEMARQLSPPSAAWLRAHPDVADRFDQAEAAHNYITKIKGVTVDTPEYFKRIEEELGITAPAVRAEKEPEVQAKPAQKLQQQAPVTQSAPSLRTGQPSRQVVTLSPAEREIARENKMTDREYAIEKMAAIAAGQIKG